MKRPDILLLHTDQQRFDTIAALGNSCIKTPNIDRLVKKGTSFTRCYSSNPVCMPARHDLLTGVSAKHHGYWANVEKPIKDRGLATLPQMLTASGYQTYAVGKMHFYPEREHYGFNHMYLMEELPESYENDAYVQYLQDNDLEVNCQHGVRPLFYHTPQPCKIPEKHHGSAWVADKTLELLKRERREPVFIFSSWIGPHPPYYVPQNYLDIYRDAPLPERLEEPCLNRQTPSSPEAPSGEQLRRIREAYYAATTLIDTHIGRILDYLEESGRLEETLILFTTDHGEMLGDLDLYQKHTFQDASSRIPLIAAGPGFKGNKQIDVPAVTWDVNATILDAAGLDKPKTSPGKSLKDLAKGDSDRTICFSHSDGQNRYVAAVSESYKFVHWYNGGDEALYAPDEDPGEQVNLIESGNSKILDIANLLRQKCLDFEVEHGILERVDEKNKCFNDFEYRQLDKYDNAAYPPWSSFQFPAWAPNYSERVLKGIANEMENCLDYPGVFIHSNPQWREDAMEKWLNIGGDPAFYHKLFESFK